MSMSNDEITQVVADLELWFNGNKDNLYKVIADIDGKKSLTVDFGDGVEFKLNSKEEVVAYRLGMLSAVGAFGELPISIEKRESDE